MGWLWRTNTGALAPVRRAELTNRPLVCGVPRLHLGFCEYVEHSGVTVEPFPRSAILYRVGVWPQLTYLIR
jgi:hypothetical protein